MYSSKDKRSHQKSKQQIFVGYDDGSKSIKYYNSDTRRVLTSRNYQFLTNLPKEPGTPEPIQVDLSPAVPHEGEHDNGDYNLSTLQSGSQRNQKRYREEPQNEDETTQRKLRKKTPVDYRRLNDPFTDEDKEDEAYPTYTSTTFQAILGTDDPKTVKEARTFSDCYL
jgi:hypothetical protein